MKHDSSNEDAIVLLKKCGYHIRWPEGCHSLPVREDGCYMLDICEDRTGGEKEAVFHFVPDPGAVLQSGADPSDRKKQKNGRTKRKKNKK